MTTKQRQDGFAINPKAAHERVVAANEQRSASMRVFEAGQNVKVSVAGHSHPMAAVVISSRKSRLLATTTVQFADGTRMCVASDRVKEDK